MYQDYPGTSQGNQGRVEGVSSSERSTQAFQAPNHTITERKQNCSTWNSNGTFSGAGQGESEAWLPKDWLGSNQRCLKGFMGWAGVGLVLTQYPGVGTIKARHGSCRVAGWPGPMVGVSGSSARTWQVRGRGRREGGRGLSTPRAHYRACCAGSCDGPQGGRVWPCWPVGAGLVVVGVLGRPTDKLCKSLMGLR